MQTLILLLSLLTFLLPVTDMAIKAHVDYNVALVKVDDNGQIYIDDSKKSSFLKRVNRIRTKGCFCGREYMESTHSLVWSDVLYQSALGHAKEMTRYNFFAHYSIDGNDIGDRLEQYGYDWQVAGENLGEGQESFGEVLSDWLDSKSHCKMLMNPKVSEMAVATHGRFWVQHFGKPIAKNYHRIGRKY
ncbi:MAG: CAP domain-containing protein [Saprospiraceae bacterium]